MSQKDPEIGGFARAPMASRGRRRAPGALRSSGARGANHGAEGFVIWLTGLPCSGKSTIAGRLAPELQTAGRRVEVLDGDVVRPHLSQELGYSSHDRNLNIRRIGFVAQLLARNGVIVIVAVVSPFEETRRDLRAQIGCFFEVHVDCPLAECERRDVKGMYALARSGKLTEFTGIDSPYEAPSAPELRVNTLALGIDQTVAEILKGLASAGRL